MVQTRRESSPSPESNKFNPTDFPAGTDILFFDDLSKKWELGMVNTWENPIKDSDGKLKGNFWTIPGTIDLKLSLPPKKLDKIPSSTDIFDIDGKKYKVNILKTNVIQDTGEVELTLENTTNPADRLENINLKTIKNLESVGNFETDIKTKIDKLKVDVIAAADSRAKEILKGLFDLQARVEEAAGKLGALSEWQDIGQAEAEQIGQEIKNLQININTELTVLENKLKNFEPRKSGKDSLAEEADGLQTRLDRETKSKTKKNTEDHKTAVENAKTVHDSWKKDKDAWDKKKKAKEDWDKLVDKKGKPDPGDPGAEPVEPPKPESIKSPEIDQAKIDATFDLFTDLEVSKFALPDTDKFKQIIKKVKDLADKQAKREGLGDYTKYDDDTKKQVIADIFQEVLNKEKSVESEVGEKFDLDKEKEELKTKIKEIMRQADVVGVKIDPDFTNEQLTVEWLKDIDGISKYLPQKQQEKNVLNNWSFINIREVMIFEAKQKKQPTREKTPEEKTREAERNKENDIDIPDTVLRELFADRPKEVRGVLEIIYNEKLKATDEQQTNFENNESVMEAMGKLMDKKPSKDVLDKLRQYGIKNWEQFQDVWKKKMAKKAAGVLHQWGQADLQSELAKQIGTWDTVKALKWQLGARIATNMALVGGGVALIVSTGGLGAGIVAAAAGGAVGGGFRALLQKFVFGSKTMEDRKKKALEEMYDNKRKEIIKNTLDKKFGASGTGGLNVDTSVIFSSIMAEAIRAASDEMVKGEGEDFSSTEATALSGDSKRLFVQALKNAREAGLDVSKDQKISMALALQSLTKRGEMKNAEAVKASDPLVIKMLDGVMAGYSGQLASRENYGVAGAAASVAAGATVGLAFSSGEYSNVARGVLGALGGATAGYRFGEGLRAKREVKKASETFLPRFKEVNTQWEKYSVQASSLTADELKKFGDEIKAFSRYLKGEADTTADQNIVALLKDNPQLRKQTENLVYQAYRRGVFARIGVAEMKKHAEEATKESNVKLSDSTKKWLGKQIDRGIYTTAGAMAGAGLAILGGMAAREAKAYFTMPDRLNTAGLDAKLAAASTAHDLASVPSRTANIHIVEDWHAPEASTVPEVAPPHQAGVVEVPGKVTGFTDWRHKVMEGMGYKFEGGKILHAMRFHPGAKIELLGVDGKVAGTYVFPKGGSTWDAMDHFHKQAGAMIKAGDMPKIHIVGDNKVEVLDNYKVESHSGGKTHMESGEAVTDGAKGKQLDWTGEKLKGVHDVPKGNFDLSTVERDHSGTFIAADGLEYQQSPGGPTDDYYVRNNHLYTFEGTYIGEQYLPESHIAKTTWSSGGAIADKPALEAMLKGTTPGGAATAETPQPAGGKGETAAEAVKPVVIKTVDSAAPAPAAEKVGTPVAAAPEVAPAGMPESWKGHEAVYAGIQKMKTDLKIFDLSDSSLLLDASKDKSGVLNTLTADIEKAYSKSFASLNEKEVLGIFSKQAGDPTQNLTSLTEALVKTGNLKLTLEERLLLGGDYIENNEDFKLIRNVSHNGEKLDAWVAKKGSHAILYQNHSNKFEGKVLITDPDHTFDPKHLDETPARKIIGGPGTAKLVSK